MDRLDPPSDTAAEGAFLPDYLLFLLAMASASASAGFHAIARSRGLKVPEWRVLACLHDEDGQMITRLAQLSLMEQSRLTRVIERMVDQGLVRRQAGTGDRRRVHIWLTRAGRTLACDMVAEARRHEAGLMAHLGPEAGPRLKALLRHLGGVGDAPAPP